MFLLTLGDWELVERQRYSMGMKVRFHGSSFLWECVLIQYRNGGRGVFGLVLYKNTFTHRRLTPGYSVCHRWGLDE